MLEPTEFCVRVQVFLAGVDAEQAFDMFTSNDIRMSWDQRLRDLKDVEKISENETIKYYIVPSPSIPFINARDATVREQVARDYPRPGIFTHVISSCDHERCPADETEEIVRSVNYLTGYKFENTVNEHGIIGTQIEWMQNNDVKGDIWRWVLNSACLKM